MNENEFNVIPFPVTTHTYTKDRIYDSTYLASLIQVVDGYISMNISTPNLVDHLLHFVHAIPSLTSLTLILDASVSYIAFNNLHSCCTVD